MIAVKLDRVLRPELAALLVSQESCHSWDAQEVVI